MQSEAMMVSIRVAILILLAAVVAGDLPKPPPVLPTFPGVPTTPFVIKAIRADLLSPGQGGAGLPVVNLSQLSAAAETPSPEGAALDTLDSPGEEEQEDIDVSNTTADSLLPLTRVHRMRAFQPEHFHGESTGRMYDDGMHRRIPRGPFNTKPLWSIQGINALDQRLANKGNQLDVEPPDQALCVGNGYIVEGVNNALRIRNATTGVPISRVLATNAFFGVAPNVNRTANNTRGPFIFDPICIFDADIGRFIYLVLVPEVVPTGATAGRFTGPNSLGIAVSQTSDPTGSWTIYRLPAQNDGSQGTPDHSTPSVPGPFLGDFPHMGHDKYGLYITTNEFRIANGSAIGSSTGVNLYAMSKRQLAGAATSGAASVTTYLFFLNDTATPVGLTYFSIQPVMRPASRAYEDDSDRGPGTMYLISTMGRAFANGTNTDILLWSLAGTSTLDWPSPSLRLTWKRLPVGQYALPQLYLSTKDHLANQKPGFNPLGAALGISNNIPARPVGPLDASDTRVLSFVQAGGVLWGAWGTAVNVTGVVKAGAFLVAIDAKSQMVIWSGVLAWTNTTSLNHVIYPTLAINSRGKGVVGFTLVGDDFYPSAGYATIGISGLGPISISKPGLGVQDGFTEYGVRPRWGDYGAAAVDEYGLAYIASEFIAADPSLCLESNNTISIKPGSRFLAGCNNTRSPNANWATTISKFDLRFL